MDWLPITPSAEELALIETLQENQRQITTAYRLRPEDIGPLTDLGPLWPYAIDKEPPAMQVTRDEEGITLKTDPKTAAALARGMKAVAKVARLYIKHGGPPKWIARQKDNTWTTAAPNDKLNHDWRRALRLSMRQEKPAQQFTCGTCNQPFVGPASGRCQCKPVVLAKHGRHT